MIARDEVIVKLLSATPETLEKVADVLAGRSADTLSCDRRLLTLTAAARELNVSRMTIHRMCADKRLPVIETRLGRRRIPSQALSDFLKRGACA